MIVLAIYLGRSYRMSLWKLVIAMVVLTVSGVAGTKIMFWIESGNWGGTSFYGAVFFAAPVMVLTGMLLQVSPRELLDICAPAECVMLVIMKIRCIFEGCCLGREIWIEKIAAYIRFPSRSVEMLNAMILMGLLVYLIHNGKQRGKIYLWYLILYGGTRFVLNCFRDTEPFIWNISYGHFWSIISMIVGIVLLCIQKKCEKMMKNQKVMMKKEDSFNAK